MKQPAIDCTPKKEKKVVFNLETTQIFLVPIENSDRRPDTDYLMRQLRFRVRCEEMERMLSPLLTLKLSKIQRAG